MIGVTLGDPAGIGPEVTAWALARATAEVRREVVVFGDPAVLARGAAAMGVALDVACEGVAAPAVRAGEPSAAAGAAQVAWLEAAVAAARAGRVDALVTAPISKTWARRAGFAFPGHTELLAARLEARDVAMAFVGPRLVVALATVHVPLVEVAAALSVARIVAVGELLAACLDRDLGRARPVRLGVVGLNPHAGEGGLLGGEEQAIIAPAVATLAAALGAAVEVSGPLVPDAAFRIAADGGVDGLVAMYHDQALIPVKLLDFEEAVNVTLGLPIVRTSPDHGTAYDLAGRGSARPTSMAAALALAVRMRARRRAAASGR
ncbi:MAG: 4-hydroxythreonine-4-phosphate dehydrogenase PdxA [Kofleriaceae bacterium]|nr:4-hydroxythreonine-4-phosphate dehydrogenase PdxA [Kofleriaceae bacterium]MCL4225678.1 4-hydroxythreonine-4-phosphate dehydrogenase PdxA [Myxococcales bacterium]